MMYDLVILGGGSAAFGAAVRASELGLETALINDGLPLGGTCVNVGCVPSKHLLAVGEAAFPETTFGSVDVETSFDFPAAMEEKDRVVESLREDSYVDVAESLGIEVHTSRGRFVSENEIELDDGTRLEGEYFLVATGSSPRVVDFDGIEEVDHLTFRSALELEELPGSLVVIGAGPVGLEFGQVFHHFGSEVTLLQRSGHVLSGMEPVLGRELQRCLEREGMDIRTSTSVERIEKTGKGVRVHALSEGEAREFEAERLFVATGDEPNTSGVALSEVGVETDRGGSVKMDDYMRTTNPRVFAAGDVTGPPHLEPLAAKQGNVAVRNAFEDAERTIDYGSVPRAVFTSPEVATVGKTEEDQMEQYGRCNCRTIPMEKVPRARAVEDTRGLVKMAVHPETGVVEGVHAVAPSASEFIHEAALIVKHGLTVDDIVDIVHVFPTFSEALKLCATAFKKDIENLPCCAE